MPFPDFIKNWSGVTLLAETNEDSGEKYYKQNRRKEIIRSLKLPFVFGVILTLAVYAAYFQLNNSGVFAAFSLLLSLKIAGCLVASLLLWYEIDNGNPVLKQICSIGRQTNCNAVLNSKQAKLFGTISWSEIGFMYFAGGFVALLAAGPQAVFALPVLAWLNVFALPYTFFSVYFQWKVAKQWCVLCLAVQVILIAEFVVSLSTHQLIQPLNFFTFLILSFFIPAVGWFLLKPILLQNQEAKQQKRELLKIKFDSRIFNALLPKQKQITVDPTGLGITIGNPNATHTLIKVCNPYCGPCAKAHPEIEKLLAENSDLKVQILFTVTNDENDMAAKPVKHLLAIAATSHETVKRHALDDWYMADKKNYEVFAAKYPMNGELKLQGDKLEAMKKWCNEMQITFTPTIFINGSQMPDMYYVGDLKYFLST